MPPVERPSFTTRPELQGAFGMVASTHWLASAAGMAMLERGGNAFDAAVAAGLTLQVVEPHLNGPGGDMSLLFHSVAEGRPRVLCGQGVAPAAATIEHFSGLGLDLVPGTGLLAACVPGAFDAWMLLLRDYGTMELEDVFAIAISHAEHGAPVVPQITATITSVEELLREHWPTSAEVYLPGGSVPAPGSLLRNPALAATYRRIVAEARARPGGREERIEAARDCFLRGFVAEAIDAYCAKTQVMDSSGREHGGLLTGEDMARWSATLEEPVTRTFAGLEVVKTGPWGQGPVLLQILALLEGFDLSDMSTAEYVHTVIECSKLAFADREAWYGDPEHVDVPLAALLSDEYTARRRELVGTEASLELRPGTPDGRAPRLEGAPEAVAGAGAGIGVGEPTVQRGDTCHLDIVDRHGNMVSATPSGGWLQSSPVVPGIGFALGTRAQMFRLEEGSPSALAPGRRPRTTLTPSLALRDGAPALAFGTPGGDQQEQWSLLFLLNHALFGCNLQQAIDNPNFHSAHFPSSFYPRGALPGRLEVESRIGEEAIAQLRGRGHDVAVNGPWSLGRVSAVSRSPEGVLRAGANPRGMQGYAVGR